MDVTIYWKNYKLGEQPFERVNGVDDIEYDWEQLADPFTGDDLGYGRLTLSTFTDEATTLTRTVHLGLVKSFTVR